MSLFFDLLSSINNPNQQGSVAQLESITTNIQKVGAEQGIDSSKMGSIMSVLGDYLGPALQQQQDSNPLPAMLGQLASGNATALQSLFSPQWQQQVVQGIAQKTGVSPNTLQGMLPVLLSSVMGLLHMGAGKPGVGSGNSLLNAFLSGDTGNDLGTVFQFANRFLNAPQS
ncbi:MAG TPA: hypothetical protein V6C57_23820 [Coleofasciculaceae cyanobacterium]